MARPRRPITGSWLVTADCCGRVRHNHQTRKGVSGVQKGLVICLEHWEPVHELTKNPPGKGVRPERPATAPLTGPPEHTGSTTTVNGVVVGVYQDPTIPENYQTTASTYAGVTVDPETQNGFQWTPPVRLKKPDGSYV